MLLLKDLGCSWAKEFLLWDWKLFLLLFLLGGVGLGAGLKGVCLAGWMTRGGFLRPVGCWRGAL